MALISNVTGDTPLSSAYRNIKRQATASREYLIKQVALMQLPTCNSSVPLAVIQHFGSVIDMFNGWAATPGIAQYARDQEANQSYDVIAEYNAMLASFISVRDALIALFPKDGNGFLLYQTLNASGQVQFRNFTQVQLATAVNLISNAIVTIA